MQSTIADLQKNSWVIDEGKWKSSDTLKDLVILPKHSQITKASSNITLNRINFL